MKRTAIILGATGLVGSNLIKRLIDNQYFSDIVSITRRPVNYEASNVTNHVVDFEQLAEFDFAFQGNTLFSCLGTTIKEAGSIAAQRKVDVDYQLEAATIALEQGVDDYFLISSSGANAKSLSPYLSMKGELEDAVIRLPFNSITILQPSLLLGERAKSRVAEGLGAKMLPMLCRLPGLRRFKPIQGWQVAQKMCELSSLKKSGLTRLRLEAVFPNS